MKSLLSEGYDPSDDNNTAILYAVINGYIPMIELLLNDSRVDISVDDYVIFTLTTNEDIIRVLLQKSYSNEYTESIIISIIPNRLFISGSIIFVILGTSVVTTAIGYKFLYLLYTISNFISYLLSISTR